MRGPDRRTEGLFSYVSCESRVPAEHPLRAILPVADAALAALSGEFQQLYALNGRPSIAPEKLLRALLLQAFYSVRSERQLMEQLDYNLLFRWFVGLGVDDPVWDVTVFTKNRDRLLEGEIAAKFLRAVLAQPKVKALLSDEHFSVDGTLIQAWAQHEELPAEGRQRRAAGARAATASATSTASSGPTTRTPRPPTPRPGCSARAKARRPSSASWAMLLMENRHGLLVDGRVSEANGTAERDVAQAMVADVPGRHRITVGGDKGFDTAGFVAALQRAQRDAARRPEHQQPPLGDRRPDHAPSGLRGEPAHPQADRGGVRLDQGDRPAAACPASRQGARRLAVHPRGRRLQPDPAAQAAGRDVTATATSCAARRTTRPSQANRTSAADLEPSPASGPRRHPPLFPQPARAGVGPDNSSSVAIEPLPRVTFFTR